MIKKIINIINSILKIFNLKIVRNSHDQFLMIKGLERIVQHGIKTQTIIDIGASDGKWSLDAMRLFPKADVLAIEPLSERAEALNLLSKQFIQFSYELCVAGESDNKQVVLNVSDDLDGSTVNGKNGEQRFVQQYTIDKLINKHKFKGPFLLKFDTHGYELPILNGAEKTLYNTNIIIMEVYNFKQTNTSLLFYEMCQYMEKLGFRCYDIVDPMLRKHDNAFWQMDIIFCKIDHELFLYQYYE